MNSTTQSVKCIKAASEVLGDKWTPQLLRLLAGGEALRFCKLQELVGGINPRTLSQRLAMLESSGIIDKVPYRSGARSEYRLTAKGNDLLPILHGMQEWGEKYAVKSGSVNTQNQAV